MTSSTESSYIEVTTDDEEEFATDDEVILATDDEEEVAEGSRFEKTATGKIKFNSTPTSSPASSKKSLGNSPSPPLYYSRKKAPLTW